MEWEPWYCIIVRPQSPCRNTDFVSQHRYTPANNGWQLAEAIPLLGLYDSFNALVAKQHCIWLVEAGIDFLVV